MIKGKLLASVVIGIACSSPMAARAAQISGRVGVVGRSDGPSTTTIIYAESLDGRTLVRPRRASMTQRNKSFVPRLLAVPAGSTVDFPNQDLIFHNVFSLSRPDPFDLGLYRAGSSKSRTFTSPASYRVFCNIHPQMTAVIVVLPTSFIAEADAAGVYKMDLPPGRYRITAWSERSTPAAAEIAVASHAVQVSELTLDESQFVGAPHKNKFGQDYPKAAYDPLKDKKSR